jgi:NAD+ synthase
MSQTVRQWRKRGVIVALSGGIDSSVVGALAVRAFGAPAVFGLLLPEEDSSPETEYLGQLLVERLGIDYARHDITSALSAFGCYTRRDKAVGRVVPGYGPGWRHKIVLPTVTDKDSYRVFSVVAEGPDGYVVRERLAMDSYLEIVAATNFKQRTRKTLEYYHADRLNYAVAGTPNLLEYDQGFFVKLGDGAADLKPIAHLYKTQVYQLAAFFGIPEEIRRRRPTTDTYSLPQSQEEFFFSLPYEQMDLCLYGRNHGLSPAETGELAGLSAEAVERVYRDIDSKRRFARYLHAQAQVIERGPVAEPGRQAPELFPSGLKPDPVS